MPKKDPPDLGPLGLGAMGDDTFGVEEGEVVAFACVGDLSEEGEGVDWVDESCSDLAGVTEIVDVSSGSTAVVLGVSAASIGFSGVVSGVDVV